MPSATAIPNFFLRMVARWGLASLSIIAVAYLLDGFEIKNLLIALIAAPTLAFLNLTIGLVLRLMTKPIIFLSLGLFLLVINAALLWFAAVLFGNAMEIKHFGWAVLAALLISVSNTVLSIPLKKRG